MFLTLGSTIHSVLLLGFLPSFYTISSITSLRPIGFSHTESSKYKANQGCAIILANIHHQLAIIAVSIYLAYSMCQALW